jgi:hypothetical protein
MIYAIVHDSAGSIRQLITEPFSADYLDGFEAEGLGVVRLETEALPPEVFQTVYVLNGAPTHRPDFPATIDKTTIRADASDKAVIANLPQPCTLMVDGQPVERKAGTLTLTSDMPADYVISCDQWPYLPWSVTVMAR